MMLMKNSKTLSNKYLILLIICISTFLSSCARWKKNNLSLQVSSQSSNSTELFEFEDLTGTYLLKRERKFQNGKLYIRKVIYEASKTENEALEKTVSVSEVGAIKIGKKKYPILRPFASQHTVWLDKKKYFSQSTIDKKSRKLIFNLESPEKKWQGKKSYSFPNGRVFCYFSQLPECIARSGFIKVSAKAKGGSMPLHIIWDSYPFHSEQYANMDNGEVFTSAKFAFAQVEKSGYKFALQMKNHTVFYHFDKKGNFEKMFWIAQGIRMIKR
jgi:hypothetical protein